MTPELMALYNLHRYQIILNAKDRDGEYQFPPSYLYAVAAHIFPYFHQSWCGCDDDPYRECYHVQERFMDDVIKPLDDLWTKSSPIPTFYEIERKYGHEHRVDLIHVFRYCYLDERFDESFYQALLKPTEYPVEAGGICETFTNTDLLFF